MMKTDLIMTGTSSSKKGLYESFYFRGNDSTGAKSFWLKHNLLVFKHSQEVMIECTLIFFEKEESQARVWKVHENISIQKYEDLKKEDWTGFCYKFLNGSFFNITAGNLTGKIITDKDQTEVTWNMRTNLSGESYFHFSDEKFYRIAFPKKKILTHDIAVNFEGEIQMPGEYVRDQFKGMNGHNWGTEHAYKYQYADCNQFDGEEDAYFDGFSAKILLGGLMKSPYLSACSMKTGGRWFHFNNVMKSYLPKVKKLTEKKWEVVFVNNTHLLEVSLDGEGQCWAHLPYLHPSGKTSIVNNTKFAQGTLKLIQKDGHILVKTLKSSFFELESLIPQ